MAPYIESRRNPSPSPRIRSHSPFPAAHPASEYHIDALAGSHRLRWPVSDRGANQTVVLGDSE